MRFIVGSLLVVGGILALDGCGGRNSDAGTDHGKAPDVLDPGHMDSGTTDSGETDPGWSEEDAVMPDLSDEESDQGSSDWPGKPCSDDSDCTNMLDGVCLETKTLGKVCSILNCTGICPDGWMCGQYPTEPPEPLFVCYPNSDAACLPCEDKEECPGGSSECVVATDGSHYCGYHCPQDGCMQDFTCQSVTTVEGWAVMQCVPESGTCPQE